MCQTAEDTPQAGAPAAAPPKPAGKPNMIAECCICIASITEPGETSASGPGGMDYPVATKCGHLFHHSCLSTWLKQKSVCPSCKDAVRKTSYFRIFLDDTAPGTADEPVVVDGGGSNPAAERRAKAEARRYAMLEEEVENTRRAMDVARKGMEEAEQKAGQRQVQLLEQRQQLLEQSMIHQHDRGETENLKRKHDKLAKDHLKLIDEAEKWRVIHDQRAKAEKIANEDADFDPAIDRPEVLKWANKQLISTKSELKKQIMQLRAVNERLAKTAEAAKRRLERQKEKDSKRRAKEQDRGGGGGSCGGGELQYGAAAAAGAKRRAAARGTTTALSAASAAAASAADLIAPIGGLLPPRRVSSEEPSQPQHSSHSQEDGPVGAATAAADTVEQQDAESSMTFEPPASPELTDDASVWGVSAAEGWPAQAAGETKQHQLAQQEQHAAAEQGDTDADGDGEDTEWATALLQEQDAWSPPPPSPRVVAVAGSTPVASNVFARPAVPPRKPVRGMARTKTVVQKAAPLADHRQQQPLQQEQHRKPAPVFGFAGAAAAAAAGASAGGSSGVPSHPVNRPLPAEFRGWTAAGGTKRGKQTVAGGPAAATAASASAKGKAAKRMRMLSSGRGHTPKVSSFFK